MNKYDLGYKAYYDGEDYDLSQCTEWRNGWLDAEFEDGFSYDHGGYYEDYDGYDNDYFGEY